MQIRLLNTIKQTPQTSPLAISNRERFLRACRCEPLDYPPMWMMRQAGRSLPEYLAVKEKHTFVEIVQTPGIGDRGDPATDSTF